METTDVSTLLTILNNEDEKCVHAGMPFVSNIGYILDQEKTALIHLHNMNKIVLEIAWSVIWAPS